MADAAGTAGPPLDADLPAALADTVAERILAADPAARAGVVRLLIEAHPEQADAIRRLAQDLAGAERLLDTTFPDASPATFGPYRVVRRLGEGAFGTVHLCDQEQPIRRQVAIKVLRPGAGDRHTLARFELERQLLARLHHPAIAQVFDAGVLPDGRPFFVMEYVDGLPIRRYCEGKGHSIDQRVALFLDLCRGVEHAHRRGIVHRDLKPANVLVVEHEGGAFPKIIDFGIAKALDVPRSATAIHTDPGRVVGTPGYMSPEQAAGRVGEVDARADVFSLGVMLYELLTGELPWDGGGAVTDTEPPRPSTRVAMGTGGSATTTSRSSPSSPSAVPPSRRQLVAALRGDLDWITLKALARERERRYPTTAALIDDLERHRQGLPVAAGPPSAAYRLRKFVRRNPFAMRAAAAVLAVALAALGFVYAHGRSADFRVEGAKAEAVAAITDATAAANKLLARAGDDRMRNAPDSDGLRQALVSDALALYDRFLRASPSDPALREQRCRALKTLSNVHWLLGELGHAVSTADAARAEAEALLAAEPANVGYRAMVADARRDKGRALFPSGQPEAAHAEFEAAVTELKTCYDASPDQHGLAYAAALREVATTLDQARRRSDSLDACRESIRVLDDLSRRQPQAIKPRRALVVASNQLADLLIRGERLDEAERTLNKAEVALQSLAGDDDPEVWQARTGIHGLLARIARWRGDDTATRRRLEAAVSAAEQWVAQQPKRLLPKSSLSIWLCESARTLEAAGAWDDASRSYRRAVELGETMILEFPEDPTRVQDLSNTLYDFARALWDRQRQADLADAEVCIRRAVELHTGAVSPASSGAETQTSNQAQKRANDATQAAAAGAPQKRAKAAVPAGAGGPWWTRALLARILDSRGGVETAALWEQVGADLATETKKSQFRLEAWLGVARSRLRTGQLDAAGDALAQARALHARVGQLFPIPKFVVEMRGLEAKLAAGRGDHAGAAAAANESLAGVPTWLDRRSAAECLDAAWRCAASTPGVAATITADYRARAADLHRAVIDHLAADVAAHPEDPWHVLPWGLASLRLARIEADQGDAAAAKGLVGATLPALEAVRAAAHADQWDEALVRESVRLGQR